MSARILSGIVGFFVCKLDKSPRNFIEKMWNTKNM